MTQLLNEEDVRNLRKASAVATHMPMAFIFLAIFSVATGALALFQATQIRTILRETRASNARTAEARSRQLDDLARAVAGVVSNQALIKDCVGLTEGGECQKVVRANQARFAAGFQNDVTKAVVAALTKQFGILKGELHITVEQRPGEPPVITVGGSAPGGTPPAERTLPPGTTKQDCLVRLDHLTDVADGVLCR